jgi:hypothetical protein
MSANDMVPMVDTCSDDVEHLCMTVTGEILHHLPLGSCSETEFEVTDLIPVGEFVTERSFPRDRLRRR